jgi:hypothetical protein
MARTAACAALPSSVYREGMPDQAPDEATSGASARAARAAPTLLVFGLRPERLLDSEQRIDAFLEPPTQDQWPIVIEALRSGLDSSGHVIAIVPQWLDDEVLMRLDMARSMLDTGRVAVHRSALPPLAATVLASLASGCGPSLPSAGLLASLLEDLEAELHVFAWLGSVAGLSNPAPGIALPAASFVPGSAFGVSSWPEPSVHRINRGDPSVPLPPIERPSQLVVAPRSGGDVEWITHTVNNALGGLPVRSIEPTEHGPKWWGTSKLVEGVVYPVDAAALAAELMRGVEPWACRWCSELIARSPCPFCGHRGRPGRRRVREDSPAR